MEREIMSSKRSSNRIEFKPILLCRYGKLEEYDALSFLPLFCVLKYSGKEQT